MLTSTCAAAGVAQRFAGCRRIKELDAKAHGDAAEVPVAAARVSEIARGRRRRCGAPAGLVYPRTLTADTRVGMRLVHLSQGNLLLVRSRTVVMSKGG